MKVDDALPLLSKKLSIRLLKSLKALKDKNAVYLENGIIHAEK